VGKGPMNSVHFKTGGCTYDGMERE
jgi:hypothetical protein